MSTQVDLFTAVEPTSISPAIAKLPVSRSTFYQGDCLVEMSKIADKSVDMILCDLPYGTTQNKWDSVIPLDDLWNNYNRIIKDNGAVVLFSDLGFTGKLMNSSSNYKYDIIWDKVVGSGFLNANKMPIRRHETILVFYKKQPTFNKQMKKRNPNSHSLGKPSKYTENKGVSEVSNYGKINEKKRNLIPDYSMKNPDSILEISKGNNRGQYKRQHPTQKPIELMEYLIKTYTNEGETVLDNCMGSGTTGVACKKTGRHFIGIEKDPKYFELAVRRVSEYCG